MVNVSVNVQPGQCQCSWHGGTGREEDATVPSTSRHPVIILTVEFAGDSIDEDATTTNNEGPQESCLSTDEPDMVQTFIARVEFPMSSAGHL